MSTALKLIPVVVLVGALVAGFTVRAPREPVDIADLKRLVLAIAALYLVGGLALAEHRTPIASVVFGSGLILCSFALWMSRGITPPRDDSDEGGTGGGGGGGTPPIVPSPTGPSFDWAFYEDQFREPAPERDRAPAPSVG